MTVELTMDEALQVFLRGFSTTRSYIHPYVPRQLSRAIWVLEDAPRTAGRERTPEVIAYGASPHELIEVRERASIDKHTLCVLIDDPTAAPEVIAAYKTAGYRFRGREPLYALDTAKRTRFDHVPIRRVIDADTAAVVARAAGSRGIFPQHLTTDDAECRLYAAFDGETPIGWARSIRTHPDRAWVAGLFVASSHRRRGIGRTLMSAMLDDDARYGVRWSVLLASLTGALLYPHLGYQQHGLLLIFSPATIKHPE